MRRACSHPSIAWRALRGEYSSLKHMAGHQRQVSQSLCDPPKRPQKDSSLIPLLAWHAVYRV